MSKVSVTLEAGMKLDVRIVEPEKIAVLAPFYWQQAAPCQFTRSCKGAGLKDEKMNVTATTDGQRIAVKDEQELYQRLDLDFIEPELQRELMN